MSYKEYITSLENREILEKNKVKILEERIKNYEEQVKRLKDLINYQLSITKKGEAFCDYKSLKDGYEGYLQYDDSSLSYNLFIKYYEGRDNKFKNTYVYGSWDNYDTPYELCQLLEDNGDNLSKFNSSVYYIELDDEINYGKYTYKFKRGGEWIEPSENELKEKDKDGNYNNVLFVHP